MADSPIRSHSDPWTTIVLLCGKCARKMNGGYGPKQKEPLKDVLRQELRDRGLRRRVRLVETRCLGVCPKKATTVIAASRPGEVFVVAKGSAARDVLDQIIDADGG